MGARDRTVSSTVGTVDDWKDYATKALQGTRYSFLRVIPGKRSRRKYTHSIIADAEIRDNETGQTHPVKIKQLTFPENEEGDEAAELWYREPTTLFGRQCRELRNLEETLKGMPPKLYGKHSDQNVFVQEDVGRSVLLTRVLHSRSDEEQFRALRQGVQIAAEITGRCTRESERLLSLQREAYRHEKIMRDSLALQLLKGRVESLSPEQFNAGDFIRELGALREGDARLFDIERVFAHGDLYLGHICTPNQDPRIEDHDRVIDWETFGIHHHTKDLTGVLSVKEFGPHQVIQTPEYFPRFIGLFLLLEKMYRNDLPDSEIEKVLDLKNGDLSSELNNVGYTARYLSDAIMAFYDGVIRREIDYAFHSPEQRRRPYQDSVEGLFLDLANNARNLYFQPEGSDPEKLREHFFVLGSMLRESGFAKIRSDTLKAIRTGSSNSGESYRGIFSKLS